MPVIPQYQPQTQGVPSMGRVPTTGYSAFQSLERAGVKLEDAADALKKRQDTADVLNAFTTWQDKTRGQAETLMSTRKGKDARGITKDYGEWYDEELGRFADDTLENDDQRMAFSNLVASHRNSQLTTMVKYSLAQDEEYTRQTVKNQAQVLTEQIGRNPQDYMVGIAKFEARLDGLYPPSSGLTDGIKQEFRVKAITTAANFSIEKNPQAAIDILDTHKDELAPETYKKLRDMADKELYYQNAVEAGETWEERIEWLSKQKKMDPETKKSVTTRLRNSKSIEDEVEKARIDEIEAGWFDEWRAGRLTERAIEASTMPTEKKVYWTNLANSKVRTQNVEKRQALADSSKELYGDWLMKVDLEPEKYEAEDIYKDLGPNEGKLTGTMAAQLRDRLMTNKLGTKVTKAQAKSVKESVKQVKSRIKAMYEAGDFGVTGTRKGKPRSAAKQRQANIVLALEEFISANPDKDPAEWFESYLDREAAEWAVETLGVGWESIIPGEQEDQKKKRIAAMDDFDLAKQMIEERRYDMTKITDEDIEAATMSVDFNNYKTQLLGGQTKRRRYKVPTP
jgi:hypothetical protein